MNCAEIKELLSTFSDREATPEEREQVKEHLRNCRECAFESTMIVGLKRLLGNWQGLKATEEFRLKVLEKVREEPPPEPPGLSPRAKRTVLAASAGALAILLGVVFGLRGAPERTSEGSRAEDPAPSEDVRTAAWQGPDEPLAQIRSQEGVLRIRRIGGEEALGSAGDRLWPGDSLTVSDRGSLELDLVEGMRLRLDGGSAFGMGERPGEGELRSGRIWVMWSRAGYGSGYGLKAGRTLVSFERDESRSLAAEITLSLGGATRVLVAGGKAEVMTPSGLARLGAGEILSLGAQDSEHSRARAESSDLLRLRSWSGR